MTSVKFANQELTPNDVIDTHCKFVMCIDCYKEVVYFAHVYSFFYICDVQIDAFFSYHSLCTIG